MYVCAIGNVPSFPLNKSSLGSWRDCILKCDTFWHAQEDFPQESRPEDHLFILKTFLYINNNLALLHTYRAIC